MQSASCRTKIKVSPGLVLPSSPRILTGVPVSLLHKDTVIAFKSHPAKPERPCHLQILMELRRQVSFAVQGNIPDASGGLLFSLTGSFHPGHVTPSPPTEFCHQLKQEAPLVFHTKGCSARASLGWATSPSSSLEELPTSPSRARHGPVTRGDLCYFAGSSESEGELFL